MNIELNLTLKKTIYPFLWNVILNLLYLQKYQAIIKIDQNYPENLEGLFQTMESYGLIKIVGELRDDSDKLVPQNISLRQEAYDILDVKIADIDDLIFKYRELFPSNYKGDSKGCRNKMISFLKQHKGYTHELILKATRIYNDEITRKNGYRQQAHYFIAKDGSSNLNAYCERVSRGEIEEFNDRKDRL